MIDKNKNKYMCRGYNKYAFKAYQIILYSWPSESRAMYNQQQYTILILMVVKEAGGQQVVVPFKIGILLNFEPSMIFLPIIIILRSINYHTCLSTIHKWQYIDKKYICSHLDGIAIEKMNTYVPTCILTCCLLWLLQVRHKTTKKDNNNVNDDDIKSIMKKKELLLLQMMMTSQLLP